MKRVLRAACTIIIPVFLFLNLSFAEEDMPLMAEGKYFSVYGYKELNIYSLLNKLDFNYFLHMDMDAVTDKESRDLKDILAKTLDSIYLETSDTLDIHIYSFHGNIKILPEQSDINALVSSLFKRTFNERSLYIPDKNTIYISFADLTLGMLGHEIAHAIINHYFVVPPPPKVQEILSGYVEYSLRKSTDSLP